MKYKNRAKTIFNWGFPTDRTSKKHVYNLLEFSGEKLDSSIWKKQKQTKQEEPTKKRPKAKKID